MSHGGDYRVLVGQEVALHFWCWNTNAQVPVEPDADPALRIYYRHPSSGWTQKVSTTISEQEDGMYPYVYRPQDVGEYTALLQWRVSGIAQQEMLTIEAVANSVGGSGDGQIIELYVYERLSTTYVIYETTEGTIISKRDPS